MLKQQLLTKMTATKSLGLMTGDGHHKTFKIETTEPIRNELRDIFGQKWKEIRGNGPILQYFVDIEIGSNTLEKLKETIKEEIKIEEINTLPNELKYDLKKMWSKDRYNDK